MAGETHGATTKLQWDLDGTPPFADLATVVSIRPPSLTKGDTKTTDLSAAAKVHSYIAGWRESGEMSLTCHFTKAQFAILLGYFNSDTLYYWRVLFPLIAAETVNSMLTFQGYVKGVEFDEVSIESDDTVRYSITIKLSGAVGFTAGT